MRLSWYDSSSIILKSSSLSMEWEPYWPKRWWEAQSNAKQCKYTLNSQSDWWIKRSELTYTSIPDLPDLKHFCMNASARSWMPPMTFERMMLVFAYWLAMKRFLRLCWWLVSEEAHNNFKVRHTVPLSRVENIVLTSVSNMTRSWRYLKLSPSIKLLKQRIKLRLIIPTTAWRVDLLHSLQRSEGDFIRPKPNYRSISFVQLMYIFSPLRSKFLNHKINFWEEGVFRSRDFGKRWKKSAIDANAQPDEKGYDNADLPQ